MKQDGNKKDQSCHCGILQDVEENADLVKKKIKMNINEKIKMNIYLIYSLISFNRFHVKALTLYAIKGGLDSDYSGATQDRKSTIGDCQFLGRRLISWQCKKQTIMDTSTTEAEYVAAASGCRQVFWIQTQMLDYSSGTINEEVYVMQPLGFQDPEFPDKVYKVEKAMYGLHQAPRAWYGTLSKYLLDNGFQRGTIDQTLFIRKHKGEFLLVQVSANTPMDKESPWGKNGPGKDVELHLYRSIIRSLMYLTASRPDIMFAVCACARHQVTPKECHLHTVKRIFRYLKDIMFAVCAYARHQVTPKECHLHAVKRIFRYLKGYPKLGLWYPKDSPFDLVAYSDSDYGGASQDHKSTSGGSASYCGQVLWIQNQLLDYGHYFIRDCFKKKLINVDHIHTDENVSNLLTKPFDAGRFQYLVKIEQNTDFHQMVDFLEASHIRVEAQQTQLSPITHPFLRNSIHLTMILHLHHIQLTSEPIPQAPTESLTHRKYTRKAIRIAQSKALSPAADEPASLLRDDRQGEAFPTVSSLDARQDRENIAKTSALPHESSPRVTSLDVDEGTASVPTVSGSFPTVSAIFTTASVEQIDAQVAREMEEEFVRENQRLSKQLVRDYKITRLHAEEELKMMIEGLDRSNEVIAKHLQEYEQAEADLTIGEKIELINELVKYQDHRAKILKYQAQQSKPLLKKEQKEFYMSILRSHAGWKTKHFRGMTLEQLKEKFISVWKKMKTSKEVSEEELKGMMQLVPLEEVYVEALQLWTLVKETFSIKQATRDKEKELWVELKRLFEPDFDDQLWTHRQAFMHDPLDWKLYDTCSVHHVFTKDEEIFMLVEMDYPLRKGLATVMISNKIQMEQYLQMASDLILKIHNISNSLR
nr:hypothetical protein [Tanacetum cinerariifolium]